ncbi:PREDICTED: G patch domain and KOW motifs-containing protein [Nicrophorus vespilloides]|uniref:G patch domain and KOW motifs-containing protein n=1 Tax=Nicrophorus vespilloides TaxID=110193 RepID=A0ABM1MLE6_NICVS|nr:PREDICTED: G patch domain and KOW motifs-containing protein [Nicrophorus vespilloides]
MAEPKKISFGFSKTKKPQIISSSKPVVEEEKKEFIECVEELAIKVKDAVQVENKPLILHVPDTDDSLLVRIQKVKELKERSRLKRLEHIDDRPDSELSLDELAARQLVAEARKAGEKQSESKVYKLDVGEDKLILEGSEQATLEDYEDVPIQDFGWAMLRGMGVTDEQKVKEEKELEVRPKGMGLGAYKVVNQGRSGKPAVGTDGKELKLVKGCCAKIIAGRDMGTYCKVHDWDCNDDGMVIVKMALKDGFTSVNEFLLIPVSTDEYSMGSKVINNAKYEQYKERDASVAVKTEMKPEPNVEVKIDISSEEEYRSRRKGRSRFEEDSAASHKNYRKDRSRSRSKSRKSKKKHRKQRMRRRRRSSSGGGTCSDSSTGSEQDRRRRKEKSRSRRRSSESEEERYRNRNRR